MRNKYLHETWDLKSTLVLFYFIIEKIRVCLWGNLAVCICPPPPHPNQLLYTWAIFYETWYVYHGTWACVSSLSLLGISSVNMFPLQWLQYMNCLTALFSMLSILHHIPLFPYFARQQLRKHVPVTVKNCWRFCFLCAPCCIKGKQAISSS
jgi:hypothetical protein